MKLSSKNRPQGSVLVITLITCGVIAVVLGSYLTLISSRFSLTMRSMGWNGCIPVLEAGIEEALTHLHADATPSANGWSAQVVGGQNVYTKQRNFADGSYFKATIYNIASTNPMIYSSGFVPAPLKKGYISRTVRVTTTRPKAFPAGIVANGLIQFGGGASVDSYNSCAGAYSTNNSLGTNATVATNFQGTPAIKVGNAHIYGRVNTGPLGTVSVATGAVGDKDWNATQSGIQPGASGNDMNVAFPTNAPPTGGPFLAPPIIVAGGSNITLLANDTYQMPSFTSTGDKKPMIVTGKATLYVTGNVTVTGNGFIQILPGASLTLIIGGKGTLAGNGIINTTGQAADFSLIGLSTCTDLNYSSGSVFIGTINAPQADFSISGTADVFGAAIVKTFSSTGGSSFHYDECLGTASKNLTISSWREL